MFLENPAPHFPLHTSRPPGMHCLKSPAAPEKGDGTSPASAPQEEQEEERLILCRECLFPITREEERQDMAGAGQHTFANPAGIVFTIACFNAAPGCVPVGPASDEFTWFPGFTWQVAVCRGCLAHLGWHFAAPAGAGFWGLILDHLIFP